MNFIEKGDTINEPRLIKIIIGDCDENIGQMFCNSLSEDSDAALTIDTVFAMRSDELIESVQINDFDIALLILNNMTFDPHEMDIRERINRGMNLVSELKHTYNLPVIALYGYPQDNALTEQILEHGAVFASHLPCAWEKIGPALYICLQPVRHKSD